jgi:hypothetical protein
MPQRHRRERRPHCCRRGPWPTPDLRSKFSGNGRSFWSIDERWDYFWPNPDGTIADIGPKICQFLS